jgi:hypothetical protein
MGDAAAAKQQYAAALRLREAFAIADWENMVAKRQLRDLYNSLGDLNLDAGESDGDSAWEYYQKAGAISHYLDMLVQPSGSKVISIRERANVADDLGRLGAVEMRRRRYDRAAEHFAKG